MKQVTNIIQFVTLDNGFMKMAYNIGKVLYNQTKWNLKTTPIAIIVKKGQFISVGKAGYGNHVLQQYCDRLEEKDMPYSACKWCVEIYHAEQIAINNVRKENINGADLYLYGHYHFCGSCLKAMEKRGIVNLYLLENCTKMFDRHNPNTILGTNKQFCDII